MVFLINSACLYVTYLKNLVKDAYPQLVHRIASYFKGSAFRYFGLKSVSSSCSLTLPVMTLFALKSVSHTGQENVLSNIISSSEKVLPAFFLTSASCFSSSSYILIFDKLSSPNSSRPENKLSM